MGCFLDPGKARGMCFDQGYFRNFDGSFQPTQDGQGAGEESDVLGQGHPNR